LSVAAQAAALAPGVRLGRFELQRVLGKGAQATVWLAHDPRLQREVALKVMNPGAEAVAIEEWLHEARAVSRLKHPNIVPVFEADDVQGQPCLVFEYVEGPTLAQVLKERAALPVREAVTVMLGVLEALREAHGQGIVHRDLKPSNILIGTDHRPRVMDFGIAARAAGSPGKGASTDGCIVGTPGYISPEAAAGLAPVPAMDVFAAGLLMAEMLTGRGLLRGPDVWAILKRVREEDLQLPASSDIDEHLRAVVQRALARPMAQRFADAAAMHRELSTWQQVQASRPMAVGHGTLDFLLRRMRHKSDFPALSAAISRIQRVASSDNESLDSLAQEILKDPALTKKLLRQVNSAHFSQAAAGGVNTVSRAVALVGFAGIRNMALSLVMLEHMQDKSQARALREEFLRSLLAAHLASQTAVEPREAEEAFIGALFQNLGRTLTRFYLTEEALRIDEAMRPADGGGAALAAALDEGAASQLILGLSFEDLGLGVAEAWGLPESMRLAMRRPRGEPPSRAADRAVDRIRWSARLGNDVADAVLHTDPRKLPARLKDLAERHAAVLGTSVPKLSAALDTAREGVAQVVQATALDIPASSAARRLLPVSVAEGARPTADVLDDHALHATRTQVEAAPHAAGRSAGTKRREDVAQMLAAGIQDITNSLVDERFRLTEVLRMVFETMLRALPFCRVVLALRDPKTDCMTGRFGLGDGAKEVAAAIRVPGRPAANQPADLFTAVCIKGVDTLISDARAPGIAARLPAWHRDKVRSPTFLVLPLISKGASFGFIYADLDRAGALELDEKELSLLRTLRNQAVMAFRQAG
jgi:eukaryotic-like serine/threonine-protein kinase